jgi:predicted transcriptional regulator
LLKIVEYLQNFLGLSSRNTVYDLLKEIDPEGLAQRLRKTCKRRVFRTHGPNHVWACDGHDKLKRFGICIYGFIDAWSRKILGMFVHVTNNDPKHIGVYFLRTAAKAGGIPLKVTSDFGSETIDMAAYQMFMSYKHAGINVEESAKRMHFTKSTHNQKIEALWSQMMKHHNQAVINSIMERIESGAYNPDDEVEK